eukprot:TRINITY_DN17308_c0_g1::TRINITY_DN17308_c0_g1_i1::g.7674::m.7674 TRINITY_DN17308_c0_g1::TRINITY_DN17308_c0_g1_i1::g.7674  ORF type:complete len:167 (+),score=5.77,zf-ribbon_3/PF13248.1/0.011,NOB1_Zn_bind/PF08772.6/0.018,NOB1_Zn_bind/PF08772.6/5.9e+03,DZR/PF12773.2/0.024,GFA/PF04828.9/0.037,zf-NADH-PPase/PF09297.6/7.3e+03,zf-NADH-PPase/PF09297.6/0.035,GNAT_acetyltran/PF12746.2/0.078,Nudix_N_2/PF14803.1/5.6e+02,Nudix_N_2/PF14803.1/0.24,PolC_DP2/PF03833.8/0.11,zinc_ribbon_2/PF13240.1/0.63,DUF4187/PF
MIYCIFCGEKSSSSFCPECGAPMMHVTVDSTGVKNVTRTDLRRLNGSIRLDSGKFRWTAEIELFTLRAFVEVADSATDKEADLIDPLSKVLQLLRKQYQVKSIDKVILQNRLKKKMMRGQQIASLFQRQPSRYRCYTVNPEVLAAMKEYIQSTTLSSPTLLSVSND